MVAIGCGCKICNQELGDTVNEMIINQIEPIAVLKFLDSKSCKVSEKVFKKHLSAFNIPFPEIKNEIANTLEPVPNNLVDINFDEYNIDLSNPEVSLELIQRITLKVFLNQSRITLQAQQNVLDGICPDIPKDILRNHATALEMLDKCTGLSQIINQAQAIKTVEAMGLEIKPIENV